MVELSDRDECRCTLPLRYGFCCGCDGRVQAGLVQAAREVVHRKLSVRETEALVRRLQNPPKAKDTRPDPDIRQLQDRLEEALGARVRIQHTSSGKGKLTISYNSADEFEGILQRLDLEH